MAEVVGVGCGLINSLNVKLAESLQKVRRFYSTVRDAPGRLADIIDEFASLDSMFAELKDHPASSDMETGPGIQPRAERPSITFPPTPTRRSVA